MPRYNYSRCNELDVFLIGEDEEGNETELPVTAHFLIHPAEPDVGYFSEYAELDYCSIFLFGSMVIFNPTSHYEDVIVDEIQTRGFD